MKKRSRCLTSLFLVFNLIIPNAVMAKERLAVMSLKAKKGLEQELANTISVEMRSQIQKLGIHEVVSQEDIDALAERTATVQKLGCDDDNFCLISFGNQLNSRFMVAGSLAKLEDKYHMGVKLLDTGGDDAGVKARASRDCECSEDELLNIARVLAVQLMVNYYKGSKPDQSAAPEISDRHAARVAGLETTLAQVKVDNVVSEDQNWFWRNKWWILAGVVVVGGGLALAGGGSSSTTSDSAAPAGNVSFGW